MLLKQILEVYEVLDSLYADGEKVINYLKSYDPLVQAESVPVVHPKAKTDVVRITIPGEHGRSKGGTAPTLGVFGWLGGIGARPGVIGYVSDGDGALASLAVAAKILDMRKKGDMLDGDVYIATHIRPDAATRPHFPVPLMDSTPIYDKVKEAVFERADSIDALISCDTTKGNRIINHCGFAISPTVKEGYILKVSEDLLDVMQTVTGELPKVFAITNQDLTPYGNGVDHLNGILQPSTMTAVPTVGVAITTQAAVAGCASGATSFSGVEAAARFLLETAKGFGRGTVKFYNEDEYALLLKRYGSLKQLQTMGEQP